MIIALLPFLGIVLLVIIIISIIASIFGNEQTYYRTNFSLPFDTTNFNITSPYGVREDPISKEENIMHDGIDITLEDSKNILAVADGKVVASLVSDDGAEYIIIEHIIDGLKYKTSYWHLKENSRVVFVGDNVKQGQQIGIIGNTGYSTGVHLHFKFEKYNSITNKYEHTDPAMIINNKVLASNINLYDYENNTFTTPTESEE